jgi:hypothetical protein
MLFPGEKASFIGVLAGLITWLFCILPCEAQGPAGASVLEERTAYVSSQVEILLRLSETSRKSMEQVYRMVDTARDQTGNPEGKNPAASRTAPLEEDITRTEEKRQAAGEMMFRITRKLWALSKNIRFYHYESLAMAGQNVAVDAAFERYKDISGVLQSQFDSLNGDIEQLRVLCSSLGPKHVALRKLKELSEKTAQLGEQIRETVKELTIDD